jgi:hypothetical protein
LVAQCRDGLDDRQQSTRWPAATAAVAAEICNSKSARCQRTHPSRSQLRDISAAMETAAASAAVAAAAEVGH